MLHLFRAVNKLSSPRHLTAFQHELDQTASLSKSTAFESVINPKAAKAIGPEVPPFSCARRRSDRIRRVSAAEHGSPVDVARCCYEFVMRIEERRTGFNLRSTLSYSVDTNGARGSEQAAITPTRCSRSPRIQVSMYLRPRDHEHRNAVIEAGPAAAEALRGKLAVHVAGPPPASAMRSFDDAADREGMPEHREVVGLLHAPNHGLAQKNSFVVRHRDVRCGLSVSLDWLICGDLKGLRRTVRTWQRGL